MEENFNHRQVPEGYFDSFYDRLKERMEADEHLSHFPKSEGFRVPPGYFESLPELVLEKTRTGGRIIRIQTGHWVAATLAVAAFVLLIWKIGLDAPADFEPSDFDSLAQADVESYLQAYYRQDLAFSGLSSTIHWDESDWEEAEAILSSSSVSDEDLFQYLDQSLDYDETLIWSYETQ